MNTEMIFLTLVLRSRRRPEPSFRVGSGSYNPIKNSEHFGSAHFDNSTVTFYSRNETFQSNDFFFNFFTIP